MSSREVSGQRLRLVVNAELRVRRARRRPYQQRCQECSLDPPDRGMDY